MLVCLQIKYSTVRLTKKIPWIYSSTLSTLTLALIYHMFMKSSSNRLSGSPSMIAMECKAQVPAQLVSQVNLT